MNGKWQVRVPKKWRSMGHAKANAKNHDQNYGEDAFDDNSDEDEENCPMVDSFLHGRHLSPSKESN